ncbi:MAG: acyl-CoA dehydrogenase family protein [Ahniella sp.]|nr:acyl-CoA dehydrogenase family protein [Ahniella sp.]
MAFTQAAPVLANPYLDDRMLRSLVKRVCPANQLAGLEQVLTELGDVIVTDLDPRVQRDYRFNPELTHFDAYGNRVDQISLSSHWKQGKAFAAHWGLVSSGHDPKLAQYARLHQFTRIYLYHPSSEFYTCPLAMSDGAVRCLQESGNSSLIDRAVPHLLSRSAEDLWISGQWMTETSGGSDVSGIETVAKQDQRGRWRLTGRKWFASAVVADMALLLARPEGNSHGADQLALFMVEPWKNEGRLRNIEVDRLKDKLGTRKLPTAELRLNGTPAELVGEMKGGVKLITPLLNTTRVWNAVCSIATLRRALALARDYSARRVVFGMPLLDHPLHQETLADVQVELEAAFHLTFYVVEQLGRSEYTSSDDPSHALVRLLTPALKLYTGKLAVAGVSECLEALGGIGYCEDSGLPALLRDAQVLPIWEGTTNVLALDVLKALRQVGGLQHWLTAIRSLTAQITLPEMESVVKQIRESATAVAEWLQKRSATKDELPAGARGLAFTLSRTLALAVLARHAEWSFRAENDPRALAAAKRFARLGTIRLSTPTGMEARMLASDIYA